MKLTSIQITKLFDLFDYDIKFKDNEPVLILTGANGFGKTMILNIVYHLFTWKLEFFYTLIFDTITINLDNDIQIIIDMVGEDDCSVRVRLSGQGESAKIFEPESFSGDSPFGDSRLEDEVRSLQAYLIKEQRLFRNIDNRQEDNSESVMVRTIQAHANELKEVILEAVQKSFNQIQALNSSYLDRLIDEQGRISEDDYNTRLHQLHAKQEKLVSLGLYETSSKFRNYSEADAKAVLVYIKDQEATLAEFDTLLAKLDLFTTILNKRRFTYKSINISQTKGFFFTTNKGKELPLNALSSGEQHEVILLYELIFNVQPNTLVLIDEPEISLHITWQKQFLKDLFRIVEIQDIQILVATHAPAIINGRWDLVYSLDGVKEDDE